jgi:RHS repeat-associated protein
VWEGDTLAFECRDRERHGRSTHYVFEPGTFVPVAQAVSNHVVELIPQPVYVFPYDIDKDPVWQHKPTPKPFDALAWYQCDHLGTPMELTGEDGEIAWRGTYKAWGLAEETRSDKAKWADIRNPLRFQGQYWDVETGLHYNRYRYYSPNTGRFVGKDPIGLAGGTNFYQYAPNPTRWTDPLGLARSGQWVAVGQGRIRIDPPHVENTDQQVHAHCQCKSRRKEVVVNIDGSQSHKSRGNPSELTRTEKNFLREKGFNL